MTQLTQTEKAFIAGNRLTMTVPDIAKHLKRGAATIYAYYTANGLKPYRSPSEFKRGATHPFRYMNRKIEKTAIGNKILGAQNRGQIL